MYWWRSASGPLGATQRLPTAPQRRLGHMQRANFTVHHAYVTNGFYSILCIFILFNLWHFLQIRLRIEVRMRARIKTTCHCQSSFFNFRGFSYSLANRLSSLWLRALSMNATRMHLFAHQVCRAEETPVTPDHKQGRDDKRAMPSRRFHLQQKQGDSAF